jgi:uncharacterized protein YcbX
MLSGAEEETMRVGTLKEIRRYPVKSMEGELLDQVDLSAGGLPGDRAWAVRDEVRGGIRGGKKIPQLMQLQARYAAKPAPEGSSPAQITLPDGTTVETGDPDINALLSKALDHEVSLWPLLPADALDHYRRGAPSHEDMETELREIFARKPDEPLPDLSLFPPEIMQFESPPGSYFDAFPLLFVSQASMAELTRRVPGSRFDARRFRPNFVVGDTGEEPFPEKSWCGQRVAIGDALIDITIECPRCVMTTHGFADIPKDPGVMRALVKQSGGNLGVYAKIETPARVRVGDPIEIVD